MVSHIQAEVKRGTGAYGGDNQASVRIKEEIPEFFCRNKQGTDIFISAYRGGIEWKSNLFKSVLENFWAAIFNSNLIVKIDDEEIDKNNLEENLLKIFGSEDHNSPYYYFLAYKVGKKFTKKLLTIGDCELFILVQEKTNKKIQMMRRPKMLVKHFDFRSPREFLGVFICDDKGGNNLLREHETTFT